MGDERRLEGEEERRAEAGHGPGRPPRGERGEEDDPDEEKREGPACGREEPLRRDLVLVEERLGRLRGPEAEGGGEPGRAGSRETGRNPREELGERRMLEVRPVGPGEGVLAAGERVERLVHRGAVEPLVVDGEQRAQEREEDGSRRRGPAERTHHLA